MTNQAVTVVWFRRDLRVHDHAALYHALMQDRAVLPLFIFDTNILDSLPETDARVSFIYNRLLVMRQILQQHGADLLVYHDTPLAAFSHLLQTLRVEAVYTNEDYEPYARQRDAGIADVLNQHHIPFHTYTDHVRFHPNQVCKEDGQPYTVFTPFAKNWKRLFMQDTLPAYPSETQLSRLLKTTFPFPSLSSLGFLSQPVHVPAANLSEELIRQYEFQRDLPAVDGTTRLSVHLRFGTLSVREVMRAIPASGEKLLNELIWREFFQTILWHFPQVVHRSFKPTYDEIAWLNREDDIRAWQEGRTGFPLVDAGMRQLNTTGWMHNRVRMICASVLTKYLLVDWRYGEAYFAAKLMDFDLASNNGGWQWAAGCGVDAAPYFRVFNPTRQAERFDPKEIYIRQWLPEYGTTSYPVPVVEASFAHKRCLEVYGRALKAPR